METNTPELTNEEYGRAVRSALEKAPVSRREIARHAGMSHTILNRIANGADTTRETAERVVDGLVAARDARRDEAQKLRDEAGAIQKTLLTELVSEIRPKISLETEADDE